MRDDTTRYDQPRTDPIPAAPDDPGYDTGRDAGYPEGTADPRDPRAGRADVEPGYADEVPDVTPAREVNGEPGFADAATDRDIPPAKRMDDEPGFADPATVPGQAGAPADEDSGAVLFGGAEAERFRGQWRDLQAGFVDNPAEAVQGADHLVDEVLQALTEIFNAHKQELETQSRGGETEDLRVAMRRYRSFFDQLLNA
jgi:hypothetical protein